MKTPKFWQDKASFFSKLLFLPAKIFSLLAKINAAKQKKNQYKSKVKVICIGNVTVGGAGKTPVAMAVADLLKKQGKKIAFLSRGYKGTLNEVIVDNTLHTAKEVGDEPLLLSETAPVIIAKNRAKGAKIAEKMGVDFLIMDDGFQNFTLYKDISILVFDGAFGVGNNKILPAGPMRENLDTALERTDFIVISGEDKFNLAGTIKNKKVFLGKVVPSGDKIEKLAGNKYIAFAGIGRPEKFLMTLTENNLDIVDFLPYPDHYYYKEKDLDYLLDRASKLEAKLITTSKDWVKIPKKFASKIDYLPVSFSFYDEKALLEEFVKIC